MTISLRSGSVIGLISSCLLLAGMSLVESRIQPKKQLNVILIVIDDMGLSDGGVFGSDLYKTPNIDKLAADGVRYRRAYSACTVCSPTRAALLTGKYPARLHITDWIPGDSPKRRLLMSPDWTEYLPTTERTLADEFRSNGYRTASIGKWHLGGSDYYPEHHGFDINIAGTDKGQPPSYFSPYKIATIPDGKDGEYLTDRESEEAIRFIESNPTKPFFLYLPHHAVHTPLMAKAESAQQFRSRKSPNKIHQNAVYAAMLESVDDSVGRIRSKLSQLGISDNTVIVFTSDNGGLTGSTVNMGVRAGKGTAYEGGVRIPLLVYWPKETNPGLVSDESVISMDITKTLLRACSGAKKNRVGLDGIDFSSTFDGKGRLSQRDLFWHFPHYHSMGATPYSAILSGDFRLIHFYETNKIEMYDIKTDPMESQDISKSNPKLAKELMARLNKWRLQVGAQEPVKNQNFNPGLVGIEAGGRHDSD